MIAHKINSVQYYPMMKVQLYFEEDCYVLGHHRICSTYVMWLLNMIKEEEPGQMEEGKLMLAKGRVCTGIVHSFSTKLIYFFVILLQKWNIEEVQSLKGCGSLCLLSYYYTISIDHSLEIQWKLAISKVVVVVGSMLNLARQEGTETKAEISKYYDFADNCNGNKRLPINLL